MAIGFVMGGAVSKIVASFVQDIINPLVGVIIGRAGDLANFQLKIGTVAISWGHFLSSLIDFLIIALVIYYGFKVLGLEKFDEKKKKE